jgi:hypothetical protein
MIVTLLSCVRTVAKITSYVRHGRLSVRPSVRPSACTSAGPSGRISVKLDIETFMKISGENPKLVKNHKNIGHCT